MHEEIACPILDGDCDALVIRDLRSDEEGDALRIFEEGFSHVYDREKNFWKELIHQNPTIVLEKNGDVICVSSIRKPQLIRNRNMSWIDLIACDKSQQRRGLGSKILKHSERLMGEMGAKKGKLFTESNNTSAVSFYSKHGWEVTDYTPWGYRHANRLTMEKVL
jgi:ribosomal protein S18 acetylase RimI-like enzyme